MTLTDSLGPLGPPVTAAAEAVAAAMERAGFAPPPHASLVSALVLTAALLVLGAVVAAATAVTSRRIRRDAVLILGISGDGDAPAVGKTALFKALRYGKLPKHGTLPSMAVNEASFAPHGQLPAPASATPLRWVDFPGHPRLRHKLSPYLASARCIVFVVDAQRFTAQARRDAELLYDVLTHPAVAKHGTPVLVFCNKADASSSSSPVKIVAVKTRLEAELERLRSAKSSGLRGIGTATAGIPANALDAGDDEEERAPLGFENEQFQFDHAPGPVTFAIGSAASQDVAAIVKFARFSFL